MSNIYQHRSLVPISASSSSSGINNSSTNGNSAVTNSHSTAQTSGSPPPPPSGMNERDRERDRASTLSGGPTNAAGTSSQIKSDPNGPPPLVVSKNGGGVASTALPIPSSVTAPTGPGGGPPNGPPLPVGVHPAAVAAQQQHAAAQAQAQAHHHHAAQQQHHHHAVQAQAAAQAQAQAMAANHSSRLADLLDFVKHEFDMMGGEAAQMKGQRDEYEHMISNQVGEVQRMQQHIMELEKRHSAMASQYEEEIKRLRTMIDSRAAGMPGGGRLGSPPDGTHSFDRRAEVAQQQQQMHAQAQAAAAAEERDRINGYEREQRERERERDRISERERDRDQRNRIEQNDRERDRAMMAGGTLHDSKRMRLDREREWEQRERDKERSEMRDYPPGGAASGVARGTPPPKLPPGAAGNDYAASPRGAPPPSAGSPSRGATAGSASGSALLPLEEHAAAAAAAGNASLANLSDLDPDEVPRELKKEGSDWIAIFNPKVKRVLDVNLVHTLMHESVVCCVRFSPDGKYLATGCNRSAQIYDTKTGAKACVLSDPPNSAKGDLYIRSVCFSPDGKFLATGAEDRQIRIWNIATKKVKHLLSGHKQEIYSLEWSRDGRIIASGSGDKTVRIWDVESGELLHTLFTSTGLEQGPSEAGVTSVSISSDSRLVAAGALDTLVRVWDAKTGRLLERLRSHKDSIYSVSFAPDGKSLVSGSLDKTLKMWDLTETYQNLNEGRFPPDTGREEEIVGSANCAVTFLGHKDYVLSVSCSPDGQWVASGSKDRGVQFWDPKTAETQCVLQGHKNSVIAINLSPAGGLLGTGSGDFNARIWSYERIAT